MLVLHFDCPENLAREHFLTRKLAGREKDDERMFEKRYKEFAASNPSIIEHYQSRNLILEVGLVVFVAFQCSKLGQIDTSGQTEVSYQELIGTVKDTDKWGSLVGA